MADKQETIATPEAEPGQASSAVVLSPGAVEAYENMLLAIPEGGDDATERILVTLANAQDVRDLDAPWRTDGLREYANTRLTILDMKRVSSQFVDGLGWFLVLSAATPDGELVTITTSAVAVVAQLAKAWQMGALPLRCIPRIADRPSRRGFYPMHLEIMR